MKVFGEDRDTLIQKRVNLVQSGHFKNNINSLDKNTINGIDDILVFDYMGSSEFECGALPKSLRRMTINKEVYKVFVFNHYKDEHGNSLKVYAPQVFFLNVQNIVDKLVVNGFGLQEYCSLHKHIIKNTANKNGLFSNHKDDRNFWWDIENDFFIFFEHTDKILQAMDSLIKRKFGYKKNTSESALNKLYIKFLTKQNISGYRSYNTSIKDYHYNKHKKVHFIEFFENASLENIFMEAMVIAKINKGTVIFNINEISFKIDGNSILDNIMEENGITLIDSCTYSNRINDLIFQYNREIEKKEKQLTHVLQLVKDKKTTSK